jgi:hypothetical protein
MDMVEAGCEQPGQLREVSGRRRHRIPGADLQASQVLEERGQGDVLFGDQCPRRDQALQFVRLASM